MAINAADARQLAGIMLEAYFEDYTIIAAIMRPLRVHLPTINWMGELRTVAQTHQAFIDSGLSIDWWCDEVDRQSTP
jgi:hypothetical protein